MQFTQTTSVTFQELYLAVNDCSKQESVTQLDIMELPSPLVSCFNKMARNGSITLTDFAESLRLTPDQANYLARLLIKKGYLRAVVDNDWENTTFKINYRQRVRRRTSSAILDTLTFNDD